jgi:hypothetical protein
VQEIAGQTYYRMQPDVICQGEQAVVHEMKAGLLLPTLNDLLFAIQHLPIVV